MGVSITIGFPLLFLAVTLQSSLMPQLRILGGAPDLVLLLVISWSARSKLDEAVSWAFLGGILQDLMSVAPLGASTLGLLPLVFVINGLNRQLYRVGILLILVLTFAGTFVKEMIFAIVLALVGFRSDLVDLLTYVLLPTAIYNVVVVLPVYILMGRIKNTLQPDSSVLR